MSDPRFFNSLIRRALRKAFNRPVEMAFVHFFPGLASAYLTSPFTAWHGLARNGKLYAELRDMDIDTAI